MRIIGAVVVVIIFAWGALKLAEWLLTPRQKKKDQE